MVCNSSDDKSETCLFGLKKPIKDPFSWRLSNGDKLNHATTTYSLAMLKQFKDCNHVDNEENPFYISVINRILGCVDERDREDFLSNLNNPHLFVNGATHEMVQRIIKQHVILDDYLTILYSLNEYSPLKRMAAKAIGIEALLDNVTKSTHNLSAGIRIDKLNEEEIKHHFKDYKKIIGNKNKKDTLFFRYISNKKYIKHMLNYFGENLFESIEKDNFYFTMRTFESIPSFLANNQDTFGEIIKHKSQKIDEISSEYFFAVQYPKENFFKRIYSIVKDPLAFSKKSEDFLSENQKDSEDNDELNLGDVVNQELKDHNSKIVDLSKEYSNIKQHAIDEVNLVIERYKEISEIDPNVKQLSSIDIERLEETKFKIYNMKDSEFTETLDFENINFNSIDDLLNIGNILGDSYSRGILIEKQLRSMGADLEKSENEAVRILIEGYNKTKDREEFIVNFLRAINEKDTFKGHIYRVAEIAEELCKRANILGISDLIPKEVKKAGLVHDFGKILIPRNILNKPSRLNDWEFRVIKKHANRGGQLLNGMDYGYLSDAASYHHEFYDGQRGYPQQYKGSNIPELARLIAYADVCDAIAGAQIDRAYDKKVWGRIRTWEDAVEELNKCAGGQFDPIFLEAFNTMAKDNFLKNFYDKKIKEAKKEK